MKKFDYVDSLRGWAIFGVLMVHVSQYGNFVVPSSVKNIVASGSNGVQLFYLASAFTLFLSFNNRFEKEKSPILNFFVRRFFRIAPMYYLGICYYLWQDGFGPRYWLGDAEGLSAFNILSSITFLHGLSPYWINGLVPGGWSISVEMMFYAILPFLFLKIKNINQALMLFLISLAVNVLLQILLHRLVFIQSDYLWSSYLIFFFPNQLPIFSLGIIMYFIVIESEKATQVSGKLLLILSGIFLAQLVILITVVLSTLLYQIIETPFQSLGKKIIEGFEKKSVDAPLSI